jgi:hypothetical protein
MRKNKQALIYKIEKSVLLIYIWNAIHASWYYEKLCQYMNWTVEFEIIIIFYFTETPLSWLCNMLVWCAITSKKRKN